MNEFSREKILFFYLHSNDWHLFFFFFVLDSVPYGAIWLERGRNALHSSSNSSTVLQHSQIKQKKKKSIAVVTIIIILVFCDFVGGY